MRTLLSVLGVFLLLAPMAFSEPVVEGDTDIAVDVTIGAIRISVTDFDEAIEFYGNHLKCRLVRDQRDDDAVTLDCDGTPIILMHADGPSHVTAAHSFVRINFLVSSLDEAITALRNAGVAFDDGGVRESAVGRYIPFADPSGNRHNLKEVGHLKPEAGVSIYNVGISVTDMPKAESFYRDVLGFEIHSRAYYPPVIPFGERGVASFILSETARKPSPERLTKTAGVGLILTTTNLEATMERWRKAGVTFLSAPRNVEPVLIVPFADPDGNIHHLVEPPTDHDAQQTQLSVETTTIDDLAWMTGTWRFAAGDVLLEETWSTPAGGAMVGMFRWVNGDTTRLFELMTVETTEDGIVFHLRHFNPGLEPWAAEANGPMAYRLHRVEANVASFENPDRDTPRRFVYERKEDLLVIRLEGPSGAGDEFRLNRVK